MEQTKKILVLCGGKFAFSAIQLLAYEKFLCGVGIGKGTETIVGALENECQENSIAFQSFANKKSLDQMRHWMDELQPDYIFSISFPFLIPKEILSYGENKFINFHPAPLPQYRGVMPIFEVLKNQETQTAICVHYMNEKFDQGNIIFNDSVSIENGETYGILTVKLSERMGQVVLNVANMVQFASQIPSIAQEESEAYYYEKPTIKDTSIHWKRMTANEIVALINACNPWNTGADAIIQGQQIKIISANVINKEHQQLPGTLVSVENQVLLIACVENQQIAVSILQADAGIMTAQEYTNQLKIPFSTIF